MDIPQQVRVAERALAAAGWSVRQFCSRAKIMEETWRYWREGESWPQKAKWEQAMRALEGIQNEATRAQARKAAARAARKKRAAKPTP